MALYNAFPLNMANAASRPANQPRQGSGLRNTTRLLAGLLTAGSASAWAAGPSVDLEASVSQQFPNDQMRVQLVKESRGHTIETLNAQVIEAINQALEKARTAPTVKAYANGINTHQNGTRTASLTAGKSGAVWCWKAPTPQPSPTWPVSWPAHCSWMA